MTTAGSGSSSLAVAVTVAEVLESAGLPPVALKWVAYNAGKRESRRIMGDHVYTMSDMTQRIEFPDTVVEEDGRPIAFVQVSGETFEKRDLELGIRDGNLIQVLSGVAEGERVVTKGAYAVRLASVSSAIPAHGHVH